MSILERGNKIAERFREVEVELTPATPDELLSSIVRLLRESGARDPDATSKYIRAVVIASDAAARRGRRTAALGAHGW